MTTAKPTCEDSPAPPAVGSPLDRQVRRRAINLESQMLTAEKRGEFDNSRSKDAFIATDGTTRAGVFLDESKNNVSVVVGMPDGGALCYSVPFEQFVSALRAHLKFAFPLGEGLTQCDMHEDESY